MNKKIWFDQLKYNKQLFREVYNLDVNSLSIEEKIKFAKEFYFHTNKELVDLINCLPNWKMHYKNIENESEVISSNLIEEYVDTFKYFMGLGQILGISLEDILKGYENKTEVVKQKYQQNQKINKLREKEVVLFDIDGVINNYPKCFLDWVSKEKRVVFRSIQEAKTKLDLKAYENLKTEYRLSGAKRTQPINVNTVKLMIELKEKGETIILFTNRPVLKYKIIYSDTLSWLKNNRIPFDAIYWSDYNQKEDIYKLKFKIKFIVEDNVENAKSFIHEKYKVYLVDNQENLKSTYENKLLFRIKNPLNILKYEKISKKY